MSCRHAHGIHAVNNDFEISVLDALAHMLRFRSSYLLLRHLCAVGIIHCRRTCYEGQCRKQKQHYLLHGLSSFLVLFLCVLFSWFDARRYYLACTKIVEAWFKENRLTLAVVHFAFLVEHVFLDIGVLDTTD